MRTASETHRTTYLAGYAFIESRTRMCCLPSMNATGGVHLWGPAAYEEGKAGMLSSGKLVKVYVVEIEAQKTLKSRCSTKKEDPRCLIASTKEPLRCNDRQSSSESSHGGRWKHRSCCR